jgi:diaminopimelate epimerase
MSSSSAVRSDRKLRIFKYQALGNSYLVLDPRYCIEQDMPLALLGDSHPRPSAQIVRGLCDKSYGIGSNGLLFGPVVQSDTSLFRLMIINSDGTTAGFSGNGVRIFAQYLRDAGYVRSGEHIRIEIVEEGPGAELVRIAAVRLLETPDQRIEVDIPQSPRFGTNAVAANPVHVREIPLSGLFGNLNCCVEPLVDVGRRLTGLTSAWSSSTLLNIGNPHCTTFVGENQRIGMKEMAACNEALRAIAFRPPDIGRTSAVFANGANLQWAYIPDRAHLELAIYERGEGPTTASGSSASAAACAAFARGLIDRAVEVIMPGGTLAIRIDGSPNNIKGVTLSGYATRILDGLVDLVESESVQWPPR